MMNNKDTKVIDIAIGDNLNILNHVCTVTKIDCHPVEPNRIKNNENEYYIVKLTCYNTGGFVE